MMSASVSQRDALLTEIYNRAKVDRDVIFISADMGAPALDLIRRDLPGQFFNAGISEQNAILVASGLALERKKVFTFAIASFITINCLEKIRVQMSVMKIPVQIIGVGGGFSYCDSGPTHHGIEDVAVMRAFPGIEILNVSSAENARAAANFSFEHPNAPRYIRLDRETFNHVPGEAEMNFNTGFRVLHRAGSEKVLLVTGNLVEKAPAIAKAHPTMTIMEVGRLDRVHETFRNELSKYSQVICLEEHFINGGLGTLIAETVMDYNLPCRVQRMGLNPVNGYSYKYGGRDVLRKDFGLNLDQLVGEKVNS